jgi:hypothetical protein
MAAMRMMPIYMLDIWLDYLFIYLFIIMSEDELNLDKITSFDEPLITDLHRLEP